MAAAGKVNPPDPLASMLAGLTINSNHRGDRVVGARLLFPAWQEVKVGAAAEGDVGVVVGRWG